MKLNLKKIGSLALLCLLTMQARAFIVFQDNFNYASGGLINVSGGTWVPGYSNTNTFQIQANGSSGAVIPGTGTADQPRAYFTNGLVSGLLPAYITNGVTYITNNTPAYYFSSNSPVAALYASFTLNAPSAVGAGDPYFAYFCDTNFDYRCRLYIMTNGAASGNFRIGLNNYSSPSTPTNIILQDLSPGNTYTIVIRYVLSSGIATAWVNPTSETNASSSVAVTGTGTISLGGGTGLGTSTCAFGLRNSTGLSNLTLGNLVVGTAFTDAVPNSVNPPVILTQPQNDPNGFVGNTATFSVLAGGDAPLSYHWYYNTNMLLTDSATVNGSQSNTLILSNLTLSAAGTYSCVVSNASGTNVTSFAVLTVYTAPVFPSISSEPASATNNTGDTASFSVTAAGIPPPAYQWYAITNSGATLKTNAISGATTTNLTVVNVTTNQSGYKYYVIVTNIAGSVTSSVATLTVNPITLTTIAYLRTLVDPGTLVPTNTTSIYSVEGIVTTWTNMTSSGNTEFYMQDGTAGICVFWDAAPASTNRPPAGALVQVTGTLNSFDSLVELEPYFTNSLMGVKIISTNNPLPAAQPLPFDPNVVNTPAIMEQLESTYFVASNVTFAASPTYVSGANDTITNNIMHVRSDTIGTPITFTNPAGATMTVYWNAYTGIPGNAKPVGPVTIYGVLGNFKGLYELTPSRLADIISYINVTNVMTNARKGDLPTNTYTENVLRPGETMTTYVSLGDPEGGTLTLTPNDSASPADGYWTNITSGITATAQFVYTPSAGDAGNQYSLQLNANSTSGNSFSTLSTVYVPTPQEQQIAITEFLVNPTTNTASAFFNPLQRSGDTVGISTNDQYIEIASQSTSDLTSEFFLDKGVASSPVFDSFSGSGASLSSSNSLVIYGGNGSGSPGISPAAVSGTGLFLPTSGNGTLVLRDNNGYIIDRVVYSAAALSTNGSMSRFPTINDAFVPQAYISTSLVTPDAQYNGGSWSSPTEMPTNVSGVAISYANGKAVLKFNANTTQASTLWNASGVTGPFNVIGGQPFPSGNGVFTNANTASSQFYFITTQ